MFEQAMLQEEVEQLIGHTDRLAKLYDQLSRQCENPVAGEQLSKLSREKYRNLELAQRMREVLD
jgi:hypothetical protein